MVDVEILFTSNPLVGHVLPMLPLMYAARAAGHEVVMATGPEMVLDLRRRGFTVWDVGPSAAESFADMQQADADPAADHDEQLARDALHLFGRPAVSRAGELIPRAIAWRPDVVVSEVAEFAGREVAAACGALPVTHGFGTHVPGLRRFVALIFDHLARALGTPNRTPGFESGIYLDPCPAALQSDELQLPEMWPIRPEVGQVGPDDRLPEAFRALPRRPLVYLTFGTVFNDPALARTVLDAIQELPISIAVTTGSGVDAAVLGPRPENVATAPFVPQALLLPQVSAVVSHTGSGTMLGALASGVPQVCLPQGADQFANADRVQAIGAGIRLRPDEVTAERLRSALLTVLGEPSYTGVAAAMRAEIAAMPTAAEVLARMVDAARMRLAA